MTQTNNGPSSASDRLIGACIRAARLKQGLTLAELAAAIGINLHRLQKLETGYTRIPVSTFLCIAQALRMSPAQLLAGGASEPDPFGEESPAVNAELRILFRAFRRIRSEEVRNAVLDLVRAVSGEE
jgi:transcriptional regulator with XRE-family HTH domain